MHIKYCADVHCTYPKSTEADSGAGYKLGRDGGLPGAEGGGCSRHINRREGRQGKADLASKTQVLVVDVGKWKMFTVLYCKTIYCFVCLLLLQGSGKLTGSIALEVSCSYSISSSPCAPFSSELSPFSSFFKRRISSARPHTTRTHTHTHTHSDLPGSRGGRFVRCLCVRSC
jgi:hypothetical protein